jgi:hypothetical protein
MGDGGVVGAHAFRSLCFDPDLRRVDAQQPGDMLLDFLGVGTDLRRGQNQGAVNVPHDVARCFDLLHRLAHEQGRVSALPFRIARRKIRSDVSRGNGPEQRVGQGVKQHISVGMAGKPAMVWNQDAADFQRDAGLELVRVPAEADAR